MVTNGLKVYAVLAFFTVLAGDFWRYSLTWYGWGAIILGMSVVSLVLVVRQKYKWRFNNLPYPLLGFLALTVLSIAWSDYRAWSVLGAFTSIITALSALALAITFTRAQLVRYLGHALRIILAGSILFELVVATIVRHPFTPWWTNYGGQKIHAAEYWSRDLLLKGDRIQGLVGNSNLLGFLALLGLIVFAIEFAARSIHRGWAVFWILVALADLLLTRSATVTIASAAVAVAAVILLLIRRARTRLARRATSIGAIIVVAVGIVGAVILRAKVLELLGKSGSLTGRTGIWHEVIVLATQRPVVGWGWISYWFPGIHPFNNPAFVKGGIQYLQAHDAWLDVWLQLGVIGLVVFIALAVSTLFRAWTQAVDRPQFAVGTPASFEPTSLFPILVLVALLAQSAAESRLLIEYGFLLLSLFAITSKRPDISAVP